MINKYRRNIVNECLNFLKTKTREDNVVTLKQAEIQYLQSKLESLLIAQKRGRIKGVGIGTGIVQQFIESKGGKSYLQKLYDRYQSIVAVATHFIEHENFHCCGNSVLNVMKHYEIKRNPVGGDRRSKR